MMVINLEYRSFKLRFLLMFVFLFCMLCSFDYPGINTKEWTFREINQFLQHAENGDIQYMSAMATMYAIGKGVEQDYYQAMKWKQKAAKAVNLPMYSLSAIPNIKAIPEKQLINKHNGLFVEEIFKFEDSMISFLRPYSNGLGQNLSAYIKRKKEGSDPIRAMLNGNGSSNIDYCQLDIENLIPLLLYIHPPTKGDVTVVDIGSGWGSCAKQLALMGYKVYSIDIEQDHLDFQKGNFCKMPAIDTFLYQYWKVNNPRLLDEQFF